MASETFKQQTIGGLILVILFIVVTIIVVFNIVGLSSPDLIKSADNVSGSGLPLASLFSSSGVVLLTFMAGLLVTLIIFLVIMFKKF